MARTTNRRAVRWLKSQLPDLVAAGAISSENARAIERHYESAESPGYFAFVLLASVGTALISAGVILLIAHNWDELSRATRSVIAFLPLIAAQALALFVLLRRDDSKPWRESVAIFDVAATGTAISLISQTYQIQGTFADFMCVWLLLSIPIVYIFRTTVGAIAYIVGVVVWVSAKTGWMFNRPEYLFFWPLLLLVLPYFIGVVRRDRESREAAFLSILLALAATIGLAFTAESTRANLGGAAFAGLFSSIYLCGMKFFPRGEHERLHPLALLGGIGLGITAVVLSFEELWHMSEGSSWSVTGGARTIGAAVELFFPVAAILLLAVDYWQRKKIFFSIAAVAMPLVAGLAWVIANLAPADQRPHDSPYSLAAALLFNIYALVLGIELLARGIRAGSITRANFGLLVIAALALARFFDSDITFLARGLGFIAVGIGFLVANIIFFKRRVAA